MGGWGYNQADSSRAQGLSGWQGKNIEGKEQKERRRKRGGKGNRSGVLGFLRLKPCPSWPPRVPLDFCSPRTAAPCCARCARRPFARSTRTRHACGARWGPPCWPSRPKCGAAGPSGVLNHIDDCFKTGLLATVTNKNCWPLPT